MTSFQALCEVVNEFAKNENTKIDSDNNDKNSLKKLIENVLKNEGLSESIDVETIHKNIIVKNKPEKIKHVCSYCKSTWKRSSALEKHLLVHTNVRPYDCKLCMIKFKTKSNLYKHCKSKIHLSKLSNRRTETESLIKNNDDNICKIIDNSTDNKSLSDNIDINYNNSVKDSFNNNIKTKSNDNNNNKIIFLAVPNGCIISFDSFKSNLTLKEGISSLQPLLPSIKNLSTNTTSPSDMNQNILDCKLKQKKPQILKLDSLKFKIRLNQITKKSTFSTASSTISMSPLINQTGNINDYINNLIKKNEYIKQNMPELNKPKEFNKNKNKNKTDHESDKNIIKKIRLSEVLIRNPSVTPSSSNTIQTTFSFNYNINKNDKHINNRQLLKIDQLYNDHRLNNDNGSIYTLCKTSNKLNLTHSSHCYGLSNVVNLDTYKNDLKNLKHLIPLNNKLIEPLTKNSNIRPFKILDDLNNNIKSIGIGRYECIECGIRTKKPSMLKKHIRSHANLRPYICINCNISFKSKGNLVKHMKTKAHLKKLGNKNDVNDKITCDNIDTIALKKQEEIEKRLIFKDNNNINYKIKKRKLINNNNNENNENIDLEYFESVHDVANSLLNLSIINNQSITSL